MLLEQAIFTSIRNQRLDGYQLAATSSGVNGEIARELNVWGPAHDSLRSTQPGATSINFHPLSDDLFCISKTTNSGGEYSCRSGGRVYTQMLIVTRDALLRFACDPLLVLQAAEAGGRLVVYEEVPATLPPLRLLGRAAPPPADLIAAVTAQLGKATMAELIAALRAAKPLAVVTNLPSERIIRAVFQMLSEEERLTVSFTTGLRSSPRRPFRLSILPDDPSLVRESQRGGSQVIEALAQDPARI